MVTTKQAMTTMVCHYQSQLWSIHDAKMMMKVWKFWCSEWWQCDTIIFAWSFTKLESNDDIEDKGCCFGNGGLWFVVFVSNPAAANVHNMDESPTRTNQIVWNKFQEETMSKIRPCASWHILMHVTIAFIGTWPNTVVSDAALHCWPSAFLLFFSFSPSWSRRVKNPNLNSPSSSSCFFFLIFGSFAIQESTFLWSFSSLLALTCL